MNNIKKYNRDAAISWLKSNQSHGAFEGHIENSMDFDSLSDEILQWYFDFWVTEYTEDEKE